MPRPTLRRSLKNTPPESGAATGERERESGRGRERGRGRESGQTDKRKSGRKVKWVIGKLIGKPFIKRRGKAAAAGGGGGRWGGGGTGLGGGGFEGGEA